MRGYIFFVYVNLNPAILQILLNILFHIRQNHGLKLFEKVRFISFKSHFWHHWNTFDLWVIPFTIGSEYLTKIGQVEICKSLLCSATLLATIEMNQN